MRAATRMIPRLALLWPVLTAALAASATPTRSVSLQEQAMTMGVRGHYENLTSTAGAASEGVSIVLGHIGAYAVPGTMDTPVIPTDGTIRLQTSRVGAPVAMHVPHPGFEQDAITRSGLLLYYEQALTVSQASAEEAAFNYQVRLYQRDPVPMGEDPLNFIRARFETFDSLYGNRQRELAAQAERILRDALKYAPTNRGLRNAFLDLLHARATAETILARNRRSNAVAGRLEPRQVGVPIVTSEILSFEALLPAYDIALRPYCELLVDRMGARVSEFDPTEARSGSAEEISLGSHLIRSESPTRSQFAASYINPDSGLVESVLPPASDQMIFSGNKDLVVFFDTLSDKVENTLELVRRYVMRGLPADYDAARTLVEETFTGVRLQGTLMLGLFPNLTLPDPDPSGFSAAIAGWRNSISRMDSTRELIEGEVNILGFGDDFLMLSQNFDADTFDTFDSLSEYIDQTGTSPLTRAVDTRLNALLQQETFRGYEDQLAVEFQRAVQHYDDLAFDVIGVRVGEPGFDTPEVHLGSCINLQAISVQVAQNRIEANGQELANLAERISNEIERRASEQAINASIRDVYVTYGDKRANIQEVIGGINAAQAFSQAIADSTGIENVLSPWKGAINGINAVAQAAGETAKGFLEGDLEQLAAQEQVEIGALEDMLLDVESQARIKDLLLDMRILVLDSAEASLLLEQELNILDGLYGTAADIPIQVARLSEFFSERYFADPIHQLRFQEAALEADLAFQEAQRWAFFMARALGFKYNAPFVHTFEGDTWDSGSVFRVRNADELETLVGAMRDFDAVVGAGLIRDDFFDWFSVRDDFFGWPAGQMTFDPVSNEVVDGVTRFRNELRRNLDQIGRINIRFSTVRQIPGGGFFLGPVFDDMGNVVSRGTYLDKIEYLQINLPGMHTVGNSTLVGDLSYGGTAFMRNMAVGTPDPFDPTRLLNEMRGWSTRHWFFNATRGNWQFRESLDLPVTMSLSPDSRVPPSVGQINGFRERSVAATDWQLSVPTRSLNQTVLNIEELDDIELYFFHRATARP